MDERKLDDEGFTGDKPDADFDHTQNRNDSISHLSSARIEQRFRKPKETEATEPSSEPKPVKARIEADGGANVVGALNFVHASDSRDASREWWALDVLEAEVRRLREESFQANRDRQREHDLRVKLAGEIEGLREVIARTRGRVAYVLRELRHVDGEKAIECSEVLQQIEDDSASGQSNDVLAELRTELSKRQGQVLNLAEERDRLRADNERLDDQVDDLTEQLTAAREAIRVMSENEGKLQARIAELETTLARVERLPAAMRAHGRTCESTIAEDACEYCAEEADAALRDDQPREPKLPYNGY